MPNKSLKMTLSPNGNILLPRPKRSTTQDGQSGDGMNNHPTHNHEESLCNPTNTIGEKIREHESNNKTRAQITPVSTEGELKRQ